MRVVVSDANVLINLTHIDLLGLLGFVPGYELVVPEQVVGEITDPRQSLVLQGAIAEGVVRIDSMDDIEGLALFGELIQTMGRGEAACLSLAVRRGWFLASDERHVFRREALKRIGQHHCSIPQEYSCLPFARAYSQWKRRMKPRRALRSFDSE